MKIFAPNLVGQALIVAQPRQCSAQNQLQELYNIINNCRMAFGLHVVDRLSDEFNFICFFDIRTSLPPAQRMRWRIEVGCFQ